MRNPCTCDTSPDPSPDGNERAEHPEEVQRPLLLTVKEAAALIGIGRTTLYRLMEDGEIDSVRIGSSRRIPLAATYQFVDRVARRTIDGSDKRPSA